MNSEKMMTDTIFEISKGEERIYSVYARMVKERVLFIRGEINQAVGDTVAAQLLYLNHRSTTDPIQIFINSPGGSVTDGLVIYDMMNYIKAPVHTFVMGQACSMGAFLLGAGEHRMAMPSARIMIHKLRGGAQGQVDDAKIQMEEMVRLDDYLNNCMASFTKGKISPEKMKELTNRDNFMSPEEAVTLGLIDKVLTQDQDDKNARKTK